MWGHGHHRKGRLSLPSIRISTAPDFSKSTEPNSAPIDRGLSSSQPSATSTRPLIVHDFQNGSTSTSTHRLNTHPLTSRATSHNASISSSSAHDSVRSRHHDSGQQQHQHLLPAFKERPSSTTETEREIDQSLLFRSLRGDYRPNEDDSPSQPEQLTAANDPFMPPELVAAIQTSMKDCAEYERQCAQLEHSIEHKILMFSHILEQYEGQDHTVTELREMISSSQLALQSATPTLQSAETTAKQAKDKIDGFEKTLQRAKEIAEKSKGTMAALEDHMKEQEVIQRKIENWQNALLGTAIGLVVLLAIILAWLLS